MHDQETVVDPVSVKRIGQTHKQSEASILPKEEEFPGETVYIKANPSFWKVLLVNSVGEAIFLLSVFFGVTIAIYLEAISVLWIFVPFSLAAITASRIMWLWFKSKFETLIITDKRTVIRKGLFSKVTDEVRHQDVRSLSVRQKWLDRILGIGGLGISSAGQSGIEILAIGYDHPERLANIIRKHQ